MALPPGTRIGSFEITASIGAGGMGEVYRATDMRLKREVAIKVLPAMLASDPDRLARFQREAEVLASLNHPNIAHIHGLEESSSEAGHGIRALVMELVEGPTLADRLSSGLGSPGRACRLPKRWRLLRRLPTRSKRHTSRASSTAISSRQTSRCGPTAR